MAMPSQSVAVHTDYLSDIRIEIFNYSCCGCSFAGTRTGFERTPHPE